MPPRVASLVFVVLIAGLFFLVRDRKLLTSKALWIPVLWLLINGSRPVSQWIQSAAPQATNAGATADQYLEGSPLDRNVYSAIEIAGLLVLVARRQKVGGILRSNAPIILFFTYCAVSVIWADYPDVAFKRWTKAFGDLEMGLLVLTDLDPSTAFKRLLTRMGFVLMPLSVLFIKYYPELGRVYNRWTWEYSYVGVTTNKNELGMVCLIVGLGAVWRLLLARRGEEGSGKWRHMAGHGALLALTVWVLLTAGSMTSLSCLLMGSSLLFVTNLHAFAGKLAIARLMMAGMIFLAVFALFFDSSGSLLQGIGKDATLTGRTDIWKGLIGMVVNPVVGAGYESFWLGSRLTSSRSLMWRLNEAHNGYLEVYLNLGGIGVGLLALMIVSGYRNVISAFRQDPDLGRIRVAYFSAVLVYSLTEAGFRLTSPTWIIFLLVTMAVPLRNALAAAPAPIPTRPTRRDSAASVPQVQRVINGGLGRNPIEALRRQHVSNRFRLE